MSIRNLLTQNRPPMQTFEMDSSTLDLLMPLHVLINRSGQIDRLGPTIQKLMPNEDQNGQDIFSFLNIKRPRGITTYLDLVEKAGEPMTIQLLKFPGYNLKAVLSELPYGQGVLLNISLGAAVHRIVAQSNLKSKDFSHADSTAEMLYMIEVTSALRDEAISSSSRLSVDKNKAEEQAFTDALTGLANRRALNKHMSRLMRNKRSKGFAVMQIDLDFFKAVNDTHGHPAGDFVLVEVARILIEQTRSLDLVARVGGDEFVLVISGAPQPKILEQIGLRVIDKLSQPMDFEGTTLQIGASIGAIMVPPNNEMSEDDLLSKADKALYLSKEQGRGRFNLFEDVANDE